eukprot:TRINITY_DN28462_c0_g2_i2.p1 TRINITY_DN28462_c0_g2~~TRINITY_DN28462_c0_g2_i2.p1  ORF type:complete len:984 (-),score=204.99 TRINITY_DN28462_c0_g2_i2:21-2972(-)
MADLCGRHSQVGSLAGATSQDARCLRQLLRALLRELRPAVFPEHRPLLPILIALDLGLAKPKDAPFAVTVAEYELLVYTGTADAVAAAKAESSRNALAITGALEKPFEWMEYSDFTLLKALLGRPGFDLSALSRCFEAPAARRCWELLRSHDSVRLEDLPAQDLMKDASDLDKVIFLRCMFPSKFLPALSKWASDAIVAACGGRACMGSMGHWCADWGIETDLLAALGDAADACVMPSITAIAEAKATFANRKFADNEEFSTRAALSVPHPFIILLLEPGVDAMSPILRLAEDRIRTLRTVFIDRQQRQATKKVIAECMKDGGWVLVENCHNHPAWLPQLFDVWREIINKEAFGISPHVDFRLWITTHPTPLFPPEVLESCVKLTVSPPRCLRAAVLRTAPSVLVALRAEGYTDSTIAVEGRNLCQLVRRMLNVHAVIVGRCAYGLGWSSAYTFYAGDILQAFRELVGLRAEVPTVQKGNGRADVVGSVLLRHAIADTYGCRVAGSKQDTLLLEALVEAHADADEGMKLPDDLTTHGLDAIVQRTLPAAGTKAHAEWCGLSPDADTELRVFEDKILFTSLQTCAVFLGKEAPSALPSNSMLAESLAERSDDRELQVALETARRVLANLPSLDPDDRRRPVDDPASCTAGDEAGTHAPRETPRRALHLDRVLALQEIRYGRYLRFITSTLEDALSAGEGRKPLSAAAGSLLAALAERRVPGAWLERSYAYPGTVLERYLRDLTERVDWVRSWIRDGQPVVLMIHGFFSVETFLAMAAQQFARQHGVNLATLVPGAVLAGQELENTAACAAARSAFTPRTAAAAVLQSAFATAAAAAPGAALDAAAERDVLVNGFFLQGCQWNSNTRDLELPPVGASRFLACPLLCLTFEEDNAATVQANGTDNAERIYRCPVYVMPAPPPRCRGEAEAALARAAAGVSAASLPSLGAAGANGRRAELMRIGFPTTTEPKTWILRGAAAVTQMGA